MSLFVVCICFLLASVGSLAADAAYMGTFAYTNVPNMTQYDENACGPCSVLQALYAMSLQHGNSVPPGAAAGVVEQQQHLAQQMGTNSSLGTLVYQMRNCINSYNPVKTYTYTAVKESSVSVSQLGAWIYYSLYYDCTPILHAKTGGLDYYNGVNVGHYICVRQINNACTSLSVMDCHYDSAYNGAHTITIQEAYDCLVDSDTTRYLIYAS